MTKVALLGLLMMAWLGISFVWRAWSQSASVNPRARLEDELQDGETILWRGSPEYRLFRSETWAAFLFGCILLLPGTAAFGLTVLSAVQEGPEPALAIPLFAGVVFLAIAGSMLTCPWRVRRALAASEFAITNRRVILVHPPGWCRTWSFPTLAHSVYEYNAEQVSHRQLKKRSRSRTDIVLESEKHTGKRTTHIVEIGLIGLDDWEQVERFLDLHFLPPPTRRNPAAANVH